jgi:lipopolysaccharide export system permease protein
MKMMSIIGRMVLKMIAIRFAAILVGISLFVLTLEIVTYANDIMALAPRDAFMIPRYLFTRMPGVLSTFLPMSLLLAILLTLTALSLRNETVAIWASGLSPLRLITMLLPLIAVSGLLYFSLLNYAIPQAAPVLRNWAVADYGKKRLTFGENDPIWLRNGNDIIRAEKASADSRSLDGATVFRRDGEGLLIEQIEADKATLVGGTWTLYSVRRYAKGQPAAEFVAQTQYEGSMRPAEAGSRSGDPEEMSLSDLSYFIGNQGFGLRPSYVYQTWWHKRISTFVTPLVIVALCIPFAVGFVRGGGLGVLFGAAVGLGFLYFILDGIVLSLGVMGFLPPWLASWLPNMAFGLLAVLLLLRKERLVTG